MAEDKSQVGARVTNEEDPEEIRREIEETREQLGETVAALAAKTDLKTRAKEKVAGVKQTVAEKTDSFSSNGGGATADASPITQVKAKVQENPIPTAAIAAFVGGFLFGRLTSR
jgi:ElaB/YqjD/DUF883 family membrane-anchored ribosome-binding protein